MSEKYLLVEHINNLNEAIKQSLHLSSRVKFTCFDVSNKYITFGATSGGIYVYSRTSSSFMKLIPNKEGSVVAIGISCDEKHIAIASSKGLVILIQNCFENTNISYQQFTEHEGSIVTAMKWQGNEVYTGDNTGRVAVVSVTSLIGKAIFQVPSASLMTLDSKIIQIDTFYKFLLISTETRTCLCDTENENYRQVGKKLRDGPFGACFIGKPTNTNAENNDGAFLSVINLFALRENDALTDNEILSKTKIFCARPGARLWQADFDGSVTCTHQFKNLIKINPSSILHLDVNVDSRMKVTNFVLDLNDPIYDRFNFGKLYAILGRFIFTYTSEAFYVFDPTTVSLVFWSNYYSKITDANIFGNFIYIFTDDYLIHTVSIETVENVILQSLFRKQYVLCADVCINFSDHVRDLIATSNKIHLISILKTQLSESQNYELYNQLSPILSELQEFSNTKRFKGSIVVVNDHCGQDSDFEDYSNSKEKNGSETFQVLKDIRLTVTDKLTESSKHIKEKLQVLEATVKNLTFDVNADSRLEELGCPNYSQHPANKNDAPSSLDEIGFSLVSSETTQEAKHFNVPEDAKLDADPNYLINLLNRQFELSKLNTSIEIQKLHNELMSKDPKTVLAVFDKFQELLISDNKEEVKLWCYRQYLSYLNRNDFVKIIEDVDIKSELFCFIKTAFNSINSNTDANECKCGYPLPNAKDKKLEFYEIGCELVKKITSSTGSHDFNDIQVPYMYKYTICTIKKDDNINSLLPLIVQYSDENVFKCFLHKFTYDVWDDSLRYLIKLKAGFCLNCNKKIDCAQLGISWTKFAMLMTESIGGISTVKLLKRYSKFVNELDGEFYQTCIFSTLVGDAYQKESVEFVREMCDDNQSASQFNALISKFLQKKYLMRMSPSVVTESTESTPITHNCCYCDLPMNVDILREKSRLDCGHLYHKICSDHVRGSCCICK